jgi:nucleoside 2-deoxyribosyltransferase
MKIFVAHSSYYDFLNELYIPLRSSTLNKEHEIFLPQEKGPAPVTLDIIKNSDLVVAEVSYPSTGQGIELGWANIFKVPIICISKEGTKISRSLSKITDNFLEYKDSDDMIKKLTQRLSSLKPNIGV